MTLKIKELFRSIIAKIFRWVFPVTSSQYEAPIINHTMYDLQFFTQTVAIPESTLQMVEWHGGIEKFMERQIRDLAVSLGLALMKQKLITIEKEHDRTSPYYRITATLPVGVKR